MNIYTALAYFDECRILDIPACIHLLLYVFLRTWKYLKLYQPLSCWLKSQSPLTNLTILKAARTTALRMINHIFSIFYCEAEQFPLPLMLQTLCHTSGDIITLKYYTFILQLQNYGFQVFKFFKLKTKLNQHDSWLSLNLHKTVGVSYVCMPRNISQWRFPDMFYDEGIDLPFRTCLCPSQRRPGDQSGWVSL